MFFWWFRPRWKSRNAKKRLYALETMDLDEKIILSMARSDSDLDVRKCAFQKIEGVTKFYSLWLGENTQEGKHAILELLASRINQAEQPMILLEEMLSQETVRSFPLSEFLVLIDDEKAKEFIFEKINTNRALITLVQMETPFKQRALDRINNIAVLSELLGTIRTNDKRSQRLVQERIDTLNSAEVAGEVEKRLIKSYQSLAQMEELAGLNKLTELDQEWKKYQLAEENDLRRRWKKQYLERYRIYNEKINEQRKLLKDTSKLLESDSNHEELPEAKRLIEEQLDQLEFSDKRNAKELIEKIDRKQQDKKIAVREERSFKGLEKRVETLLAQPYQITHDQLTQIINNVKIAIQAKTTKESLYQKLLSQLNERASQQENPTGSLAEYKDILSSIKKDIAEGETNKSSQTLDDFETKLKNSRFFTKAEFEELQRYYREVAQPLWDMQQWEKWGSRQTLENLCEEAELLKEDTLSTDLVIVRLKQLRSNWKDASRSNPRLARSLKKRFDEACEAAFSSVREERQANSKHREIYIEEAESLLNQLSELIAGIDVETGDWTAIQTIRTEFLTRWNDYLVQKSTGEVLSFGAPLFLDRDKRNLERKMRLIIKPLNELVRTAQSEDRKRRTILIDELKSLAGLEDMQVAVDRAREIRREFTPKIGLRYRDENRLWRDFRRFSNQIFEKQQERLLINDQEREVNAKEKQAVLDKLKQFIIEMTLENSSDLQENLNGYDSQWELIGVTPKVLYKALEDEFLTLKKQALQKRRELLETDKLRRFDDDMLVMEQISALESKVISGNDLSLEMLDHVTTVNPILKKRIDCLARIFQGNETASLYLNEKARNSAIEAKKLCILKEILMEKESPDEDRDIRLQLQVEQLPKFMMGNVNRDIHKQLSMLYNSWFENIVGIIDESLKERFFK